MTAAFSINNRGQILGTFEDAGRVGHGFLLDDGVFTTIDLPGAAFTEPTTINDRGQIVGLFADAGGVLHGFLLDEGAFTQIDFPGAPNTIAGGINNRGQISGLFGEAFESARGFLLDKGAFTTIDVPGATATLPGGGINDRGQIVGAFTDSAGAQHGLLATKEQFNGKAIRVGEANAAVEIGGTFVSPTDLDLYDSTLTITSLLNEQAGGGELVSGPPLVLTAVSGSRRNFARFVDQSRPNFASVSIHDAGSGKFSFEIKVNAATISSPQNCSPARLTTGFRLDATNNAPIVVSTERPWVCSGPSNRSLETHRGGPFAQEEKKKEEIP